ncbi:4-demethylwyosine synthase TYW1 [Candidatus Woesearchaeota archaeon]|nr:MAG: 4-demethylwyosine synthase TYW1 [Candidatus Woesearchaeota archaeon]
MKNQITTSARKSLEKQQYRLVGSHSAVKVCHWTKSMIRGRGGCYKFKFYGIRSHQCMQMTTSLSCANRCTFCWRDYKAPVSKEWKWSIDDPEFILSNSLKAHEKLLIGFGGYDDRNDRAFKESKNVKHVALSLTGEPIIYPKINELIRLFHKNRISTFLVTNGQYPEQLRNLERVTQLYISVDAPNRELLKEIDKPLFHDYWARLRKSLEIMAQRKDRSVIRITAIKDLNMCDEEGYAELIRLGDPDFIEVKGYMYIGASMKRLKRQNMPNHKEVKEWSSKLLKYLPDYELVSEHKPSIVTLLAKKKFKGKTLIDFDKFFKEVITNKP